MTAHALGRMRHLDLLALWHRLNPDMHEHAQREIGRLSHDCLAAAILRGTP
jgi:hypothetical protein